MSTSRPNVDMPDVPEIGLHDLFFDKYGFVRKVAPDTKVCTDCGRIYTGDHCIQMGCYYDTDETGE